MMRSSDAAWALFAAALLGANGAGAADVRYTSWQGVWHLNKAETHYPAGVLVTANDMIVTKDDGTHLKYSETVTVGGKTTTQAYDGAYDGKPYPVGNGETLTFQHIDANSYSALRHNKDGFVLERSTFELTDGGKKLICHAWAQQPGRPPVMFDEIFDKAG